MELNDVVQEEPTSNPTLDKITNVYIKIRDARSKLAKEFEAKDKELEEQLQILAEKMLETCKQFGCDSIKTPHGTIIRSVKSRYWTNDWDSMYRVIK